MCNPTVTAGCPGDQPGVPWGWRPSHPDCPTVTRHWRMQGQLKVQRVSSYSSLPLCCWLGGGPWLHIH